MSTAPGDQLGRRPSVDTLSLIHLRRRGLFLLGAVVLGIGPALFLPDAAPASRQHRVAHSRATGALPGETSGAGETSPASGESEATSGEATPGSGEAAPQAGEPVPAPGESTPRSGKSTPAPGDEPRGGRRGSCHVVVEVAPRRVTAGETATVAGSLSCASEAMAAEQTITIYQHTVGTPGYSAIGTATVEANGALRFTTQPLETDSVFYVGTQDGQDVPGARSRPMSVNVAPLVTIGGPPAGMQLSLGARQARASARASNTVTFTGTVSPDEAGAAVVLQREGSNGQEDWNRIGVGEVGADGAYSITHTFGIPGTANVRVIVHPHGLLPGASESLSLQIVPRQNPQLTIQASPRPLTYGQALTISGAAAGAAGQSLTLLASSDGRTFAPVASTESESGGSYAFSAQSPTQDTWYKVAGANTSSTRLFEGVSPQVSAAASSPSVPSGAPVVFTGTVTPAHAGEVVELERQNPDGLGFHVVQSGVLSSDGSFSIEHVVSGTHAQAFRVMVRDEDSMQASASGLLEIQIAPASGIALEPQAPAESLG